MTAWPRFAAPEDVVAVEAMPLSHWLPGETLPDIVANSADRFGDRLAQRFLATPDAVPLDRTFQDVADRTRRVAHALSGLGVTRNSVVASLLPALPDTLPLAWGAAWAGIYMPINPFLEPAAIAAMLRRADATVLIVEGPTGTQGVAEKLPAIRAQAPDLENVLTLGERHGPDRLEDVVDASPERDVPMPDPSDAAAYFHTGGTTGLPKIAPLSHANLAFMAFLAGYGGGMRAGDVIPCGMPLFHVGGLVFGGLAPLAAGAATVQLGRAGFRDPAFMDRLWDVVAAEHATLLFGPPTVARAVMERAPQIWSPQVRHWVSSAAALPAETHRRFTAKTGLPVKEAWGLTEASLVLTFTPPDGEGRAGSVGPRLPYCDLVAVRKSPTGEIEGVCEAGEPGVILARSPGVFDGYLSQPDIGFVTSEHLAPGRWLDTGDMGYRDEDGYWTITGRAKDLIMRGGHNIDPRVIEDAFHALPEVVSAAAVGRPDARLGEVPLVFLTLTHAADDPGEIAKHLCAAANPTIAERAARPKSAVILPVMPLTAVGKIDKAALRRQAARMAAAEALNLPLEEVRAKDQAGGQILIEADVAAGQAAATLAEMGLALLPGRNRGDR